MIGCSGPSHRYRNVDRLNRGFRRGQLVSAAAFSLGHGGNDAQKTMGVILAVLIAQRSPARRLRRSAVGRALRPHGHRPRHPDRRVADRQDDGFEDHRVCSRSAVSPPRRRPRRRCSSRPTPASPSRRPTRSPARSSASAPAGDCRRCAGALPAASCGRGSSPSPAPGSSPRPPTCIVSAAQLMDRRALFFLGAAVVSAVLIPVTESEQRWVPVALAVVYALLAVASWADRPHASPPRSPDRAPTPRSSIRPCSPGAVIVSASMRSRRNPSRRGTAALRDVGLVAVDLDAADVVDRQGGVVQAPRGSRDETAAVGTGAAPVPDLDGARARCDGAGRCPEHLPVVAVDDQVRVLGTRRPSLAWRR